MSFLKKPFAAGILYALILLGFTAYAALDTFVIPRTYSPIISESQSESSAETSSNAESGEMSSESNVSREPDESSLSEWFTETVVQTDMTYSDPHIAITITKYREYGTDIFLADIRLSDPSYLKTAFAKDSFGQNIRALTSTTAKAHNALLAINGDYYGARVGSGGYVLRNGMLYQDRPMSSRVTGTLDDLVMWNDGSFSIINEKTTTADSLMKGGARHLLSFGPTMLSNGQLTVSPETLTGLSRSKNPRTAIGIVDIGHYVFAVAEGRQGNANAGLTVYEMALFLQSHGVTTAYNLDGGGSSTLYFNGQLINHPTDGTSFKERSVSDIVYIGY